MTAKSLSSIGIACTLALAVVGTASAATAPKAGTYILTSITNSAGCGAKVGTVSQSVFNLVGPGKTGNYSNTDAQLAAKEPYSDINSTYSTAFPAASGTWTGNNVETAEPSGTVLASGTFTWTVTFIDANDFIATSSGPGVSGTCQTFDGFIRVGK